MELKRWGEKKKKKKNNNTRECRKAEQYNHVIIVSFVSLNDNIRIGRECIYGSA
jgi:hypothetical protein